MPHLYYDPYTIDVVSGTKPTPNKTHSKRREPKTQAPKPEDRSNRFSKI